MLLARTVVVIANAWNVDVVTALQDDLRDSYGLAPRGDSGIPSFQAVYERLLQSGMILNPWLKIRMFKTSLEPQKAAAKWRALTHHGLEDFRRRNDPSEAIAATL